MSLELYQRISLLRDLPEHRLHRGDVATVVDWVDHPHGGERGCVLEIFNALGKSLAVTAVPLSAVEPLRDDEVLAVRPLARAG